MKITIKTSMTKIPEHCGECKGRFSWNLGTGQDEFLCGYHDAKPRITDSIENKTLHPDCPIVSPDDLGLKAKMTRKEAADIIWGLLKLSREYWQLKDIAHRGRSMGLRIAIIQIPRPPKTIAAKPNVDGVAREIIHDPSTPFKGLPMRSLAGQMKSIEEYNRLESLVYSELMPEDTGDENTKP